MKKSYGQIAYEGFYNQLVNKYIDSEIPFPSLVLWDDLDGVMKMAWEVSAKAVLSSIGPIEVKPFEKDFELIVDGETIQVPSSASWNPYNKLFQCHRDGHVIPFLSDFVRNLYGLPIPWTPEIGSEEIKEPPFPPQ